MTSNICFDYVCRILESFGEKSDDDVGYIASNVGYVASNVFEGPSTYKVIGILFPAYRYRLSVYPNELMLAGENEHFHPTVFRIITKSNRPSSEYEIFYDTSEVFEITKLIQHSLFKTEIERLMYPLPHVEFIDKELV